MTGSSRRSPSVLVASEGEWFGRSLESVLELNGYAVTRVAGGAPALDAARDIRPDAVLLDDSHADLTAAAVCRALRDDPSFDHATPLIVTSPSPTPHRVRTEAYAAGAWDFCSQPLDVETFLLKLATFIRARRELALAQSLVDPATGSIRRRVSSSGPTSWAPAPRESMNRCRASPSWRPTRQPPASIRRTTATQTPKHWRALLTCVRPRAADLMSWAIWGVRSL